MIRRALLAAILCATFGAGATASAQAEEVRIPFNSKSGHPSILLAWRNTFKIFEAEIAVKNFREQAIKAGVVLEVLNDNGTSLMRRPDVGASEIILPGKDYGGSDGTIVQVRGSREANLLIDVLDRQKEPYHLRASVYDIQSASSPVLLTQATRSFHTNTRVTPGTEIQRNFTVRNEATDATRFKVNINRYGQDYGKVSLCSRLEGAIEFDLKPNESLDCFIRLATNSVVTPDTFSSIILSWDSGSQLHGRNASRSIEWYLTSDSREPELHDFKLSTSNGVIELEVLASAGISGIQEASGVSVQYSTDGGITFSNKILAYLDGNFTDPTRFFTKIGPLAAGTHVSLWLTMTNGAGNTKRVSLPSQNL